MNSFQRKSLYAALAGAGALGVTGVANAVNVSPGGLGQVLIYPYYTVNSDAAGNAYNSLLSVVNSTNSAKVVKVRILEGKNSREVLDFNLFLSKHDVWTAGIIPSPTSGGGRIITFDKSCTIPGNSALQAGVDFVNFAYTGSNDDKGGSGLDRTKEGYVEIIEMGSFRTAVTTYSQITHVGGVPFNCAGLSDTQASDDAYSASGGLFGGMSLINVGSGTDYTEDAVALQRFNQTGLYQPAGSILPQLTDSAPKTSVVFGAEFNPAKICSTCLTSDLGVYLSKWPTPTYLAADTVSAALMHNAVMNEYVIDPSIKAGTDWVVTFPTKRFYVNVGTGSAPKLFQRNFNGTAGACDDISLSIYNREEQTSSSPVTFSPPPPTPGVSICWEANVITFNNTNVLASSNKSNINPPSGFTAGWLRLTFSTSTSATYHTLGNSTNTTHVFHPLRICSGLTKTYLGLPVVGFAVQSYTNGTLVVGGSTVLANYGGNFVHKVTTVLKN
jgi:hypothetical protein